MQGAKNERFRGCRGKFPPCFRLKRPHTALPLAFARPLSRPRAICRADRAIARSIAAVEVKFPFVEIWTARQHRSLCLQRSDVAMCGDDEAVRHGGETAKGAAEIRSAYTGIRANGRCRAACGATGSLSPVCQDYEPTCPCPNP